MLRGAVAGLCGLLSACSGISVQALKPDLSGKQGQEGLIYYLPKPYLLVAELPPTTAQQRGSPDHQRSGPGPGGGLLTPVPPPGETTPGEVLNRSGKVIGTVDSATGIAKDAAGKVIGKVDRATGIVKDAAGTVLGTLGGLTGPAFTPPAGVDKASSAQGTPAAIPPAVSNTSFGGTTPQYLIRLVYLPDLSRPMAVTAHNGLFGKASMKPSLQDGWMLTALEASSDSQVPEALAAVASMVGSALGAGTGIAPVASTAKKLLGGAGGAATPVQQPADLSGYFTPGHSILRPGLYSFKYDTNGDLLELKPVTYFTGCGAIRADDAAALSRAAGTGLTAADCFAKNEAPKKKAH